jgi:monoamine oxidase
MRSSHYDVAVLGAGAAGLAAAQELSSKGLRVVVVDARDRIGGRIYTIHPPHLNYPIEMGAEFIHGTPSHTWDLIDQSGLTAYEVPDRHWLAQKKGNLSEHKNFWNRIDRVLSGIDPGAPQDRSFRNYLESSFRFRLSRRDRRLATAFVEGFNAASQERISAQSLVSSQELDEALEVTRVFRLVQGYDQLVKTIWSQTSTSACSVLLNHEIGEIRWKTSEVALIPKNRELETIFADQAIITLPLGVLALNEGEKGSVAFSPSIPEKADAINWLEMGPVVKIILHLNSIIWEELGLAKYNFIHANQETSAFPTWWNSSPVQIPILTGWAGGPAAQHIVGRTQDEILELALHSLSRVFSIEQSTLRQGLESFYTYDWQSDPFSRGAYSYVTVGGRNAQKELAKSVDDTLFFAGEATVTSGLSGTVDGAVTTGKRAAFELMAVRRIRDSEAA